MARRLILSLDQYLQSISLSTVPKLQVEYVRKSILEMLTRHRGLLRNSYLYIGQKLDPLLPYMKLPAASLLVGREISY